MPAPRRYRGWVQLVSLASLAGLAACTAGTIEDALWQHGDNGDDSVALDAGSRPTLDGPRFDPFDASARPDASLPPDARTDPMATFEVTELSRDAIVSIAKASVGYTYWWGHGSLGGSTTGSCTGNCPSCSHTGQTGADCSGFVGKAWMLSESLPIVGTDRHPFSTYNFSHAETHWSHISRDDVARGDALVYNQDGAGHIFLYEKDDPWGQMWSYEARGCSYGIVHNVRTAGSMFGAIRRNGL